MPHRGLLSGKIGVPVWRWRGQARLQDRPLVALARPAGIAGVCHGVCVDEDLWDAYDQMGLSFQQHAADSAYNAHYDLWVPTTYATRWYSWMTLPARLRRRTRKWSKSVMSSGSGRSGAAWFRVRCGRCVL